MLKAFPFIALLVITLFFFHPVYREGKVPLPGDFVVGVYYPWLDYKWGYEVGVPVKNPMTTDVVSFTYPMQMLAVDLLKKGELPLWNPYILAGTPLLANFQSAPFSPTNFVYFFFDKLTGWSIQIMLQHILAAAFTYLLLRHWNVSGLGSIFGGIAFAFSGFNLLWSQWNGHALAASFIPLLLFLEDKLLLTKRLVFGAGVSVVLAFQVLSGYPQVMIYSFIAISLLWLFRWEKSVDWVKKTLLLGLFSLLGLGLAAFQILPGAELLSLSQRQLEPHPFEWAFLPFVKVITFFAPDYFGNHATQNYWGPQDYTSNTGFVGVVGGVLAALAFNLARKKREVLFGVVLLVIALILSFPTPVSIFLWESGFLGFNAASAHRALILFNLAVALLVGFGVDYLINTRKPTIRWTFLIPGVVVFGFGIYALISFFLSQTSPDVFPPTIRGIPKYIVALRNLVIPTGLLVASGVIIWFVHQKSITIKKIGLGILFLFMVFELFRFGWKFTPFSPRRIVFPTTPILEFLMQHKKPVRVTGSRVIPINMRMPYKLESLEGYDAVYPLVMSQFIAAINSQRSGTDPVGRYGTIDNITSPLMDLVNTKYYLTIKRDEKNNPSPTGAIPAYFDPQSFKLAFEDKSVAVLESKTVLPRAFMVYDWDVVDDDNKILDELLNPQFPLNTKIILEEEPNIEKVEKAVYATVVDYKKYADQESVIRVNTPMSGLLFVSDTFYPGWKAYVDGEDSKIFRANFAFRAIQVTAGEHEVRLEYRPDSFYNGLKISVLSLIGLFFLLLVSNFVGKNRAKVYT